MGKLMCLLFWECHYSTLSPSKRSVKARGKRRTFTGSWTRFPIDCTFVHDDFIKVDNVLLTERFQPLITLLLIFVVRGFSPRDSSYLRIFLPQQQVWICRQECAGRKSEKLKVRFFSGVSNVVAQTLKKHKFSMIISVSVFRRCVVLRSWRPLMLRMLKCRVYRST